MQLISISSKALRERTNRRYHDLHEEESSKQAGDEVVVDVNEVAAEGTFVDEANVANINLSQK